MVKAIFLVFAGTIFVVSVIALIIICIMEATD